MKKVTCPLEVVGGWCIFFPFVVCVYYPHPIRQEHRFPSTLTALLVSDPTASTCPAHPWSTQATSKFYMVKNPTDNPDRYMKPLLHPVRAASSSL